VAQRRTLTAGTTGQNCWNLCTFWHQLTPLSARSILESNFKQNSEILGHFQKRIALFRIPITYPNFFEAWHHLLNYAFFPLSYMLVIRILHPNKTVQDRSSDESIFWVFFQLLSLVFMEFLITLFIGFQLILLSSSEFLMICSGFSTACCRFLPKSKKISLHVKGMKVVIRILHFECASSIHKAVVSNWLTYCFGSFSIIGQSTAYSQGNMKAGTISHLDRLNFSFF
jgi:hypothetical protein